MLIKKAEYTKERTCSKSVVSLTKIALKSCMPLYSIIDELPALSQNTKNWQACYQREITFFVV